MKLTVAVLAVLFIVISSQEPGFKTIMNQKGLDYTKKIAMEILQREVKDLKVPDQKGTAKSPLGSINWSLTKINIKRLEIPTGKIEAKTTGVGFELSGIKVHISFRWKFKKRKWPKVGKSGGGSVASSNSHFGVTIHVNRVNGQLKVNIPSKAIKLNSFKVKVSGSLSWLINLILGVFKKKIKSTIEKSVGSAIQKTLASKANSALSKIPYTTRLPRSVGLDYSVTKNIIYGKGYFNIPIKGEFFNAVNRKPSSYKPDKTPELYRRNKMIHFVINDYLPLSAGETIKQKGILKIDITNSMLPSGSPVRLTTNSFKSILPEIQRKFPNHQMIVKAFATSNPTLGFNSNGKYLILPTELGFYVIDPKTNKQKHAFTLIGLFNSRFSVLIKGLKIVPRLHFMKQQFKVKSSSIGEFSINLLNKILDFGFGKGIVPLLNALSKDGYPLPTIPFVQFIGVDIKYNSKYIVISSDVKYIGGKSSKLDSNMTNENLIK
eukprot:gene6485-10493_t